MDKITPEELEKLTQSTKEWITSEEGQKALTEAREQAEKAIRNLNAPRCICSCPVHGRWYT